MTKRAVSVYCSEEALGYGKREDNWVGEVWDTEEFEFHIFIWFLHLLSGREKAQEGFLRSYMQWFHGIVWRGKLEKRCS